MKMRVVIPQDSGANTIWEYNESESDKIYARLRNELGVPPLKSYRIESLEKGKWVVGYTARASE